MRGLPEAETRPTTRIRRWDAVVLGTALPGLVAAARLGMHGARVLVLEEAAAAHRSNLLREPFWMGGVEREGVLGACLRSLRVPLIDQRRIEPDPVAFQIALPHARLDVGEPLLTVDEWVAWGLAEPEQASALASALAEAGEAERDAMLQAGVVHAPRRIGRRAGVAESAGEARPAIRPRGIPPELGTAPPRIAALLAAQVRALSNLGSSRPSAEAGARLLGAPFGGSAAVRGGDSLRDVLRRRIETLYGEFRTLPQSFRLVAANGQPGVAPDAAGESGEVWVGRAFVFNAPRAALAGALAQQPAPDPLEAPPPGRRRLSVHLRLARELVPEAMAPRLVIVGDEAAPPEGTNLVTLRKFPGSSAHAPVELVAQALVPPDEPDPAAREAEVVARVAQLLPFAGERLERIGATAPVWDDDALLSDPVGGGWPAEAELRLPTRQPIYTLERGPVASLGFEGDLLLGWRGGDAIAADLS